MELRPADHDRDSVHRVITSIVTPRPIGWISSLGPDGTENLAPFSYFNAVSTAPPVVLFSPRSRADGELKDTARNVLETGEFVANLVTEAFVERMDRTSESLDRDRSEFVHAGLETVDSTTVDPPRVAGVAASMECVLHDSVTVYDNTVIFGEVTCFHVADDLLTDGRIDATKVDAIGRIGGPYYTRIDRLDVTRGFE